MVNSHHEIRPLVVSFLEDVVQIHKTVLGYTMNSRLGDEHLAFMYRQMSGTPECFTGVALVSGCPVGVISGSANMDSTKSMLLKNLTPALWINFLTRLLKNPELAIGLWNNGIIDRPVFVDGKPVTAILTTIAISPDFQGLDIGRQLVNTLELFFIGRGIKCYRVDTLVINYRAREFYKKLSFKEVATRTDSVILIKGLLR
jgi:hypothetical protein